MKKNSIRRYANKEEIDQAFEVARELLMSLRDPPLLFFHEVALKLTGMRHKSIAELVQDFNTWNKRIQEQFDLWSDVVSVLAWNELFAHSELDSDAQSFSHRLRVTVCLVHNWIENLESVLRSIGGKDPSELQLCELNRESSEKLREALRRYPLRLGNTSKFNELDKPLEKMHSRLLRDLHLLPVSKGIDETGKQAGKGAENGDGLPSAALGELIGAGLVSVLNEARKLRAVDRHSRTMMEMLAKDASKYDWTLDDWVVHLKASKKTIKECPAWKHILQWREDKKRKRPRAE